ncbi:uridine kinase [Candidatus Aerophobetes bacterium]|uniref:Uridine kinase n=1 Tax=Aerophobetes bacterium TaxID=2030807 RepID=A0A2A4YKU6_UNCAE|nr:MAG: uridine kinase [Candidatus Aerophobetes bacterium]
MKTIFGTLLFFCVSCSLIAKTEIYEPIIVGIAGGTGSGKTYLSNKLLKELGDNVAIVYQDAYYKGVDRKTFKGPETVNFDHPDAIDFDLLVNHLKLLKNSVAVQMPTYDFVTSTRNEATVEVSPKNIILVEGILLLAMPEIRELLDIKIFIDTDDDIRVIRRVLRDTRERGRSLDSIHKQYVRTVHPMYKEFVHPSKTHADILISGNKNNEVAIDLLVSKLKKDVQMFANAD